MSIKETMNYYFETIIKSCQSKGCNYPVTSYDIDKPSSIYIGEPNQEELIYWLPKEKEIESDFALLEKEHEIAIHQSIKDYFNSFYFCQLGGRLNDVSVQLLPNVPEIDLLEFSAQLEGYATVHTRPLKYIPIGIDTRQDFLIVINNKTGTVELENFEDNSYQKLADSLESLIVQLAEKIQLNIG